VRNRAVLPNVERRLTSLAKKRAAEKKRRRRRGPGFAIIVFAGLALAGSVLAASGVWDPLGGDHHGVQHRTRGSDAAEVQAEFAPPALGSSGESDGGHRHLAVSGPAQPSPGTEIVEPVLPQTGQAPLSNGAGGHGPSNVGGADPTNPGESGVGGAKQVEPSAQEPPAQGPPSQVPPPAVSPPARPTHISAFCGPETEAGTVSCRATVSGEVGAPTGEVLFEDPGPGRFSAGSCVLNDDGNGISSSCTVEYAPALPTHEAVARYSGDTANAPSSGSFAV
jgi:hypothetical protein